MGWYILGAEPNLYRGVNYDANALSDATNVQSRRYGFKSVSNELVPVPLSPMLSLPRNRRATLVATLAVLFAASPLNAQQKRENPAIPAVAPSYPIYADLVLSAPVIVDATIRSASRLKLAEAIGLQPGKIRFYVEADVIALVRGPQALPPRIGYLFDLVPDSRGRVANLKKSRVLLFARGVPGGANQLQLVRSDAQRDWTPESDALVRRIVTDVVKPDAPPAITGIGNAFHTTGALPGEGETQIFLTTAQNRPVSLSVSRRAGQEPRWSVSLGDVVDENATAPTRDTLLWYRLACALPPTLPDSAIGGIDPASLEIARADYAFVLAALGPCTL